MPEDGIVVVVGKSPVLDQALDALATQDLPILAIPTITEAGYALLGSGRPMVRAVLVSLVEDPEGALELVRSLRNGSALASILIGVWARRASERTLASAFAVGADSGVALDGGADDAVRLARMIRSWAVPDQPERTWWEPEGFRADAPGRRAATVPAVR